VRGRRGPDALVVVLATITLPETRENEWFCRPHFEAMAPISISSSIMPALRPLFRPRGKRADRWKEYQALSAARSYECELLRSPLTLIKLVRTVMRQFSVADKPPSYKLWRFFFVTCIDRRATQKNKNGSIPWFTRFVLGPPLREIFLGWPVVHKVIRRTPPPPHGSLAPTGPGAWS